MGIQGLLPFLKKVSRPSNIKDFRGCTVAIDTYCWLHRGAFACAEKLATGQKTDQYVFYCMKYINNLLSYGIKPIMVFDGCHLPSKKAVEKTRRERREMNRKKAAQLLREGKRSEARDALVQCIDITSQMALELMNACREKGVDCIVAPYEADAQLAYLNKIGVAQVVITEDSDLLLFGCERVMFKMDISGNGMLIRRQDLAGAMNLRPDVYTFDKFRYMCILSGCDYLPSLPGIGLGKANKVFQLSRQQDMKLLIRKLPSTLNMNSLTVPLEYIEGFTKANNTFLYQLVYDPLQKKVLPLNPYPPELDTSEIYYAGPAIAAPRAFQIALGNMDVNSGERIADFDPLTHKPKSQSWDDSLKKMPHMLSIWDPNYRVKRINLESDPRDVERPSTKGKEVKVALPKSYRRQSPVKRPRIEDTEEDSLGDELLLQEVTNADLASMYSTSPGVGAESTDSAPPTKRSRTNLMEAIEDTEDPELELGSSPPDDQSLDSVKENLSKTPKNKFAVGSDSSKKNRFCLNATRKTEIKSRFFATDKPMHKTSFYDKLEKGSYGAGKLESSCERTSVSESSPEKPASNSNSKSPELKPKPKPKGASGSLSQTFSFKRKDGSDTSQNNITNSAAVTSQFKPHRTTGTNQKTDHDSGTPDRSSEPDTETDSTDTLACTPDTLAGSPVSMPSSLYSIDSDCVTGSQESNVSTSWSSQGSAPSSQTPKLTPPSQRTSAASRLSLFANKKHSGFTYPSPSQSQPQAICDLTMEEESEDTKSQSQPSRPSLGATASRKGCRTVGLSKASPRPRTQKQSKTDKKPGQQASIKSFLSNFQFSKDKKRMSLKEDNPPDLPSLEC